MSSIAYDRERQLLAQRIERNTDAEIEAIIGRFAQDLARADKTDGIVESHRDNVRTVLYALVAVKARNADLARRLREAEKKIEALEVPPAASNGEAVPEGIQAKAVAE